MDCVFSEGKWISNPAIIDADTTGQLTRSVTLIVLMKDESYIFRWRVAKFMRQIDGEIMEKAEELGPPLIPRKES